MPNTNCQVPCSFFPRPDEVLSVEKKNGKSAHISWIMPSDLERWKPLIYIIQQKSHIGMVKKGKDAIFANPLMHFALLCFCELIHVHCIDNSILIWLELKELDREMKIEMRRQLLSDILSVQLHIELL